MSHFHLDGTDLQVFSSLTKSAPKEVDFHGGTWKKLPTKYHSLDYKCESLRSSVSILLKEKNEHVAAIWRLHDPTPRDLYLNTIHVFMPKPYIEDFLTGIGHASLIKSDADLKQAVLPPIQKMTKNLSGIKRIPNCSLMQMMLNALIASLRAIGAEWPELDQLEKSPELSAYSIKEKGPVLH